MKLAARVVETKTFNRLIIATIVAAGVLAGIETNAAFVDRHHALFRFLDGLILSIFGVEAVLKIAAHGRRPWRYFFDPWNIFDFIVLLLCLLPAAGPFAAVLRLARALRLLRLVSALPKLQLLVGALLKSFSAMGYVGVLLGLMFYIYAVAGVHLFGGAAPEQFGSLSIALLSLFQLITLEGWVDVFGAVHSSGPVRATVYFISFIVLGTMIMLNLFIGVIMNSMSEMHAEIDERDRARHVRETGEPTVADDFRQIEQQMKRLQEQLAATRLRVAHSTPAPPGNGQAPTRELPIRG
ncbi:MAG TPA: ion transporter [Chthoniobacterales bacterium]|nr:ion transporter [Chthoniobacterales bacterium]